MPYRQDFTVFNSAGELTLVVEVKARPGASPAWAAQLRRNLLAHGFVAKAKYFLLALPDRFFLWKEVGPEVAEMPPTHQIDAALLLGPYFERAGVALETASGDTLELAMAAWLRDLINEEGLSPDLRQAHPWLAELSDELRGGRVACEAVA